MCGKVLCVFVWRVHDVHGVCVCRCVWCVHSGVVCSGKANDQEQPTLKLWVRSTMNDIHASDLGGENGVKTHRGTTQHILFDFSINIRLPHIFRAHQDLIYVIFFRAR